MSRRHDQSYKLLFSLPIAIEHLINGLINADLAAELDFDRAENLATEGTTTGLVRSQADLVWKIHFRGSSRFLLLLLEFQSESNAYMAARTFYYIAVAYHSLLGSGIRSRGLGPSGLLPPVLSTTIYNGRHRWTAANEVFELIEPVQGWLATRQPRLRHEVLDLRDRAGQSLPTGNVISWISSLERDSSAENVMRVVRAVLDEYPEPQFKRLREAFREWILGAAESWGIDQRVLTQVKSLKEAGMIYAGVEELKERAHREGLGRGRATMVCRQARLKFGAETAEQLARLLAEITDPDRIARIGDRIIVCDTGAELLASIPKG